ncbi:MAG: hypothetical protein AAAB35_18790 [Phyllobacterium sp.]|uniref:S10 family serine carboxypeptidase-like protein n=1 Tax=Phyllobacterium sp. TaxID=1871046 RepID=UPI0030F2E821
MKIRVCSLAALSLLAACNNGSSPAPSTAATTFTATPAPAAPPSQPNLRDGQVSETFTSVNVEAPDVNPPTSDGATEKGDKSIVAEVAPPTSAVDPAPKKVEAPTLGGTTGGALATAGGATTGGTTPPATSGDATKTPETPTTGGSTGGAPATAGGATTGGATPPATSVVAEVPSPAAPIGAPKPNESELVAFERLAPKDNVVKDANIYDMTVEGSIDLDKVSEITSVKRQTITIDNKAVPFTARSGHLVAYTGKSPERKEPKAQAAIFYTSYTRDGLPKDQRPVTFFWNGGPGSGSIWLHMGSWAPKRIKTGDPIIPQSALLSPPTTFPVVDNTETLLDKTDLVFVDPPGTGLSTAVAPFINKSLWGTDIDTEVLANFITRYVNVNNRQSSHKYLYGESYGGIRTPIVANQLLDAGTSNFEPDPIYGTDPTKKSAKVLAGIVLNSPILDYGASCSQGQVLFCTSMIPSFAMAADYHKKSSSRGPKPQGQYLQDLRTFVDKDIRAAMLPTGQWTRQALGTPPAYGEVIKKLSTYTGISTNLWATNPNLGVDIFKTQLIAGNRLNVYDARMKLPSTSYDPKDYYDKGVSTQLKDHLQGYVNYSNGSTYEYLNKAVRENWQFSHRSSAQPSSLADIQAALIGNPDLIILILHGYEDLITPGLQTEVDLKRARLSD